MLNDNAKAVISKLQYIIDRFVKVRFYSTPKRIANEPHDVEKQSDNKYIAFFSEIISDREIHTINVYKEPTAEQPVPDFPEYELVDRQPLKKNECYVDRENNLIYFHSSQIGAKISVTYYSIGVGMLSSALIYTHFDSNNKIIETLFDLTRRCQEELDRVSAVTDAEQLKVELKSYIESLLELMRLYPNPKEIIKELEEAVRNGNDLMAVLGDVVAEGQRLMEEIKTASNKSVTIQPSYWASAGSGRYKYEYTHNLNTFNLVITTTQIVSGIETSTVLNYEKPTSNKIVFYTSDNTITAKAVISASYYPGFLSDIGTISADSVVDGTEKVSMTVEERNGLIKAQNDIKRIDSDLSEAKQDIVDLNEDLDGLNGEFVTHKNDYNTFKTQTNNTLASHSNILTIHSSQLEQKVSEISINENNLVVAKGDETKVLNLTAIANETVVKEYVNTLIDEGAIIGATADKKDIFSNFYSTNIFEPMIVDLKCYGFEETDYLGLGWIRKGYTSGSIANGICFYYYTLEGVQTKEAVKVSFKNTPSGTHTHVLTISDTKFIIVTINWDKVPNNVNNYLNDKSAIISIKNLIKEKYIQPIFSSNISTSIFEQYIKNLRLYIKSSNLDNFYILQIKNNVLDSTDNLYKSKIQVTNGVDTYLWEDNQATIIHTGIETLNLKDANGNYSGYITIDWDLFYYVNGYVNYGGQNLTSAKISSKNIFFNGITQSFSYGGSFKTDKAILTIIDDDGYSAFLTQVKTVCDELGVKASLALITSKIGSEATYLTRENLATLHSEGYDLLSHSYSHDPSVFNNQTTDLTNVTDEAIRNEYKKGYDDLKSWGYTTETIVYPWGGFGAYEGQIKRYTNLAKEVYQFGVTSGGGIMTDEVLNTYWLYREFVFETNGLDYYKNLINNIKNNKGWLILGTHSGRNQFSNEFLKSILQYAISNGVEIMTFKDANEIKRNIVSFGTFGEKSNSIYIGRNGVLKNN